MDLANYFLENNIIPALRIRNGEVPDAHTEVKLHLTQGEIQVLKDTGVLQESARREQTKRAYRKATNG